MKTIIRLTESDLHRLVKESVRRIIMEQDPYQGQNNNIKYTGENGKDYTRYYNLMRRSRQNGGADKLWVEYLAKKDTFMGYVAKMVLQNNHDYTDLLNDLEERIMGYMNEGRFGTNDYVLETIYKFCGLLSFINGQFEKAAKAAYEEYLNSQNSQNNLGESLIREAFWDGWAYKNTNKYGVRQKFGDDKKGQWMRDLQAELKQLLEWNYLHGAKTTIATEAFIQFLEVERRGILPVVPLKKMAMALAGVAALTNVLDVHAPGVQDNPTVNPQQPQVMQVQNQQQQGETIYFQVNSAELTPGAIQKLQKLAQGGGTFEVIVHESQNSSGVDAQNEKDNSLIQARIDEIGKYIDISTATRGTNNQLGQLPSVEINPVN